MVLEEQMVDPYCLCAVRRPPSQVRNAMDRARMNSAIRVFNSAVMAEGDGGFVSEKVRWPRVLFFVLIHTDDSCGHVCSRTLVWGPGLIVNFLAFRRSLSSGRPLHFCGHRHQDRDASNVAISHLVRLSWYPRTWL